MFKLKLRKLNASNSTNKELKSLLNNNKLKSGDGIWTLNQTDGFGQRGSAWKAQANKHLALSFFYKFENLNPKWIFSISSACSLAVLETLSHFNVNRLSVKWPNDILAGNKKICGILAENQINELKIKSIVGIGININSRHESTNNFIYPSVSLMELIEKEFDVLTVIEMYISKFSVYYSKLINNKIDIDNISKNLYGLEKKVSFRTNYLKKKNNSNNLYKIINLNKDGTLRVEDSNGQKINLSASEISN